jgi:hypothetical protein
MTKIRADIDTLNNKFEQLRETIERIVNELAQHQVIIKI